ncbi:helix-turn-helix domain-containing protein [Streptomyces sp. NPDC093544]|uniref:helix-turn-helix domain-containing protein n=1 Tax=Streptomyces sp. NPDC093544 TaxID=3155200 RepID=UPI00343B7F1F
MSTVEQPPALPALAPLRQARERFLTGRPLPDGVPDEVVAAWRRARFFGVPHDLKEPAEFAAGARPESPLLSAARPVLERLAPALGTGRSSLVLTDERLRVLWAAGSVPGNEQCTDLSEREVGHNSAALALRTRRRAEVHGPEHFLDLWQDVSAVSVPVLGPETGQALGTVTVASGLCAECSPHPGAALAEATAAAVEAELLARTRAVERVLLDAYLTATRGPAPAVVALDGRNRLVSEAAARMLSPEGLEALERGAGAVLRQGVPTESYGTGLRSGTASGPYDRGLGSSMPSGPYDTGLQPSTPSEPYDTGLQPSTPMEPHTTGPREERPAEPHNTDPRQGTPFAARPVVELPDGSGCTARLTPVRHLGSVIGLLAVLEPLAATTVPPTPRAQIPLTGRSVPWRLAVERAAELARSREPLLLTGERGTGKTILARELSAEFAPEFRPLVVDAAEGELGVQYRTLTDGRPLLLRHAERLAQPDVAALNSLLDEHPGVPLLVTYTPGTPVGPCLQRLLDTLAARTVTLPALRERPEDIREFLTALAPKPARGRPPLTWTLDALRALEQHPWPGNVTELAHLVRALADDRRPVGPVRRAELPDAVREGPAERRLSPMEHAERTAILEALRRHGGNKARAAAALGIGRATLYRKLRGYRDTPHGS